MKKTIGIMGVIALSLLTASVQAQTWEAQKNPTVDSIAAKYKDKVVAAPVPITTDQVFPVIGKYESSTNPEAAVITISLDEQNKGVAWIDGLPQGRIKAMLRRSPAVYKIPAQKTEEGKDVAEGTLIFDKETNTLSICLGKEYNVENPSAAFTAPPAEEVVVKTTKSKTKVKKETAPKPWMYTATKIANTTAMTQ